MRYYCVLKSLLDLPISHRNLKGRFTFFALFNFQDAVPHPLKVSFFYYTTDPAVCQPLFRSFSNFFRLCDSLFLRAALILYHFSLFLSIPFFRFFQKSFRDIHCLSSPLPCCASSLTFRALVRQLYYYSTFSSGCQLKNSF